MMRSTQLLLIVVISVMPCSQSAWGCLNDQELPQREREFRSQYQSNETVQVEAPVEERLSMSSNLIPISGVAMLIGSVGLIWLSIRD